VAVSAIFIRGTIAQGVQSGDGSPPVGSGGEALVGGLEKQFADIVYSF